MTKTRFGLVMAVPLVIGAIGGAALAQSGGQAHRVNMVGSSYAPATLAARVGDTLKFVNDDTEDHTVFVPSFGFGIDFGTLKPGAEASMQLGRAGRFRVECVNHAAMLLDVTVTK